MQKKAQQKSVQRRKNSKFQSIEIVTHPVLRTLVETALLEGYSPASIAGRIKYHHPELPTVSKNTIYRFLASPYGREFEGLRILHQPRKNKKPQKVSSLPDRVFIDQKPKHINDRSAIGDAEADFIVSGRKGHGILLVVIDRKLRVGFWEKESVENVNKHIRKRSLKGSDISTYSQKFISETEVFLNQRYMECLDFATPQEALLLYRKNLKISKKMNTK